MPSDSTFAIAMKNQQQAEKEEQQRIKNLVLNYDLQQSDDQEGTITLYASAVLGAILTSENSPARPTCHFPP